MDNKHGEAFNYLQGPAGSFWKWDDQGEVVAWTDGSTLAFREELLAVVKRLAPRGLPPIDSLMMLLASTRENWFESSSSFRKLLSSPHFLEIGTASSGETIADVFGLLDDLHNWPAAIVQTFDGKSELAAMIFETATAVVTSDIASIVVEVLEQNFLPEGSEQSTRHSSRLPRRTQSVGSLIHDLWPLRNGLSGLTIEKYQLRCRTGLDAPPEPAPIDFPIDRQTVQTLLQQLISDENLSGLARVARNLSAVVQLPRSMSDIDDLHLGGVSDLTNRGSLDRLLLSELAHDDLVLTTRLALNEALFLRREVPPGQPSRHSYLLIDSGLRTWGIPRLFGVAVGLALATSSTPGSTWSAYKASGVQITPIDLATRDGLLDYLEVLEPDLHPGEALADFLELCETDGAASDVVIVTTQSVVKDPEFQRSLTQADGWPVYIAVVDREGNFELWLRTERGRKPIASLRLNAEDLLKPPANLQTPLIDSDALLDHPAIFRLARFPFRMPYHFHGGFEREVAWSVPLQHAHRPPEPAHSSDQVSTSKGNPVDYGVMILTRDRRLLLFDSTRRGAAVLGEQLPFGRLVACLLCEQTDDLCAVIYQESKRTIYLLRISRQDYEIRVIKLESKFLARTSRDPKLLSATLRGTTLFVIYRELVEAFSVTTGAYSGEVAVPEQMDWVRGRFFVDPPDKWYTVWFDGSVVGFQRIPFGNVPTNEIVTMFDRSGIEGPFVVYRDGTIRNLYEREPFVFPRSHPTVSGQFTLAPVNVIDVDGNGHRLLTTHGAGRNTSAPAIMRVLDLEKCRSIPVPNKASLAQVDSDQFRSTVTTLHRLSRALIWDEQLILVTKNQTHWKLSVDAGDLVLRRTDRVAVPGLSRSFETVKRHATRYSLQQAKWNDGSSAWIDSRGLLHLKSSDQSIPEATILLVDGSVVVWVSDGRMFGRHYFLDLDHKRITPQEFEATILKPFVSRLR